ncbi:unnamed protein product [Coregonus sp. 'balchen']|nr:unnamed protein product [Coregonus sp. 'balchen']
MTLAPDPSKQLFPLGPLGTWRQPGTGVPLIENRSESPLCPQLRTDFHEGNHPLTAEGCPTMERTGGERFHITIPPEANTLWGLPKGGSPTMLRTDSVLDVLGGQSKTGFSSITITSHRVSQSGDSQSQEALYPHLLIQPVRSSISLDPVMSPVLSSAILKHSELVTRHNATIVKVTEYRQSYYAGRERGLPGLNKHSYIGGDRHKDNGSSYRPLSLQPSFHSCVQLEVPLRSANLVLYLDKSLSISIGQPEGKKQVVHRSTLSLYVGSSSHIRTPMDNPKTHQDLLRSMGALRCTHRWHQPETDVGHKSKGLRGPQNGRY